MLGTFLAVALRKMREIRRQSDRSLSATEWAEIRDAVAAKPPLVINGALTDEQRAEIEGEFRKLSNTRHCKFPLNTMGGPEGIRIISQTLEKTDEAQKQVQSPTGQILPGQIVVDEAEQIRCGDPTDDVALTYQENRLDDIISDLMTGNGPTQRAWLVAKVARDMDCKLKADSWDLILERLERLQALEHHQ